MVPPLSPATTLSFTYVPLFERLTLPSIQTVPLIESCWVALFQARCPTGVPALLFTVQSKLAELGMRLVVGVVPFAVVSLSNTNDPGPEHTGECQLPMAY